MNVYIKLNDMNFRYDVYQIVNLFFDYSEIKFIDDKINIANNEKNVKNNEKNIVNDKTNLGNRENISIKENEWNLKICVSEKEISIEKENIVKSYIIDINKKINLQIRNYIFLFLEEILKKELPWGTLIGIRPSKIASKLLKAGKTKDEIKKYFNQNYFTREDKANLCIEISALEDKYITEDKKNISIYVGMPFCPTRCLYCSFTSNPIGSNKQLVIDYLNALKYEIETTSAYVKENGLRIQSVYFGGGTPTAVSEEQFAFIMEIVYNNYVKDNNIEEFTVECGRPDSITKTKLLTMKKYGVHRISINPQTMNDRTLKTIGRSHSSKDIIEKFNLARELGFDNINMDVIIGLMGEGLEEVKTTCSELLKLKPDSLTVHGLSIKRGSRLHESMIDNFKVKPILQSELNEMYEETTNLSKSLNMKPYYMYRQKNMVGSMENVGYSNENREGIYNILMIEERQTIIAVGADAVTKVIFNDENRIERSPNVKDVKEYINRVEEMANKKLAMLDTLYK